MFIWLELEYNISLEYVEFRTILDAVTHYPTGHDAVAWRLRRMSMALGMKNASPKDILQDVIQIMNALHHVTLQAHSKREGGPLPATLDSLPFSPFRFFSFRIRCPLLRRKWEVKNFNSVLLNSYL